jgi:hypothetical protein
MLNQEIVKLGDRIRDLLRGSHRTTDAQKAEAAHLKQFKALLERIKPMVVAASA